MNLDLNTPFHFGLSGGYFLRGCAASGRAFVLHRDAAISETLLIYLNEFGALCADSAAVAELENIIGELLVGRGVEVDPTEY